LTLVSTLFFFAYHLDKNGVAIMKHFISITAVSQITGISKSRLYKLTALGLIPHYKPTGKLLFKLQEVIEWVESSKNKIY
jgi:excisionase family DNA binding protein